MAKLGARMIGMAGGAVLIGGFGPVLAAHASPGAAPAGGAVSNITTMNVGTDDTWAIADVDGSDASGHAQEIASDCDIWDQLGSSSSSTLYPGKWIWDRSCTLRDWRSGESHTFTKSFYVPGIPTAATVGLATDNFGSISVNGVLGASSSDWATPTQASTSAVQPGWNTLSLTDRNVDGPVGTIADLSVKYEPFATSAEQCKSGGWTTVVAKHGSGFKNQGDCVSYVATGGTNPADG